MTWWEPVSIGTSGSQERVEDADPWTSRSAGGFAGAVLAHVDAAVVQ